MHVKTNIEHSLMQVIIISICPILALMNSVYYILTIGLLTVCSFLISVFVCFVFNKFLHYNTKIFITALLTTFIVTIANYFIVDLKIPYFNSSSLNFYAVLTTICLSVDVYFVQIKTENKHYFGYVLLTCVMFAIFCFVMTLIYEILGFGTAFGILFIPGFWGAKFCQSIIIRFVLLGLFGALFDGIYRKVYVYLQNKKMTYNKLLKKIRLEKSYQYNRLREKKQLSSDIEIRYIDEVAANIIKKKSEKNEEETVSDEEKEQVSEEDKVSKNDFEATENEDNQAQGDEKKSDDEKTDVSAKDDSNSNDEGNESTSDEVKDNHDDNKDGGDK